MAGSFRRPRSAARFGAACDCSASGRRRAGRPTAPSSAELAETALNALAAIRSSAELLREDGIAPAERSRFAEIVLAEERRLGTLVAQLVEGGRRSAT